MRRERMDTGMHTFGWVECCSKSRCLLIAAEEQGLELVTSRCCQPLPHAPSTRPRRDSAAVEQCEQGSISMTYVGGLCML